MKIIVFQIGTEYFGIEAERAKVIIKNTDMVRISVAHSPDIIGILNHDGDVIPIVDLYKKMQAEAPNLTNIPYFMIVSFNQKMMALPFDKMDKYYKIENSHLYGFPLLLQNPKARYFQQIANFDGRLILIIDPIQLFGETSSEKGSKKIE